MESIETTRMSEKGQVVIPKKIREEADLKPGDELTVTRQNGRIILRKRPKSYTEEMWGLHREVWSGVDATEYVSKERGEWRGNSE